MKQTARSTLVVLSLLAAGVFPACGNAEEIQIGGTGAGLTSMRLLAEAYMKTHPDLTVKVLPSLGSSGGIKAVAAGAVQLALSSRELTEPEQKQGLAAVEYARTPLVFAVSVNNPVDAITTAQLVNIYSGKTVQWPDGVKIHVVLRPPGDADSAMVRGISPEMEQAKKLAENRPGMLFAITDQDTQDNIERIPGALGATSLGQIIAEQRRLKALTLNSVRPSPQNLANGSYPYAKVMFLVTSPKTPLAAQGFVAFVRSPTGRDLLSHSGYWVR